MRKGARNFLLDIYSCRRGFASFQNGLFFLGCFLVFCGHPFPLMMGGCSSVVLSFQWNALAYGICRLLKSGGPPLASVCVC